MILKVLIIAVFILSIILFIIARRRYKKKVEKEMQQVMKDLNTLDLEEKVKEDLEHVGEVDWELKNHNHIPKEMEVKVVDINNPIRVNTNDNSRSLKDRIDISKYPLIPEDCFLSKEEQEEVEKEGLVIGGKEEGDEVLNLDDKSKYIVGVDPIYEFLPTKDVAESKIMIGKIVDRVFQAKVNEERKKESIVARYKSIMESIDEEEKEDHLRDGEDELLKLLLDYLKTPDETTEIPPKEL